MKKARIPRPTEDSAIGRVSPRILAAPARLLDLLAAAVRRRDRHGAQLLRAALARTLKLGVVGEP
ncbi:hypothetical protein [Streptomyces sp. CB03911]|uniref:hypothetical protein n=1 Tax=Streptomyces sp. CB03911 TaxID=1804758 RepID=UPI000940232A|nr:hypothetical protein [Streptomyces sp. CB03911]OKI14201.1 hypothetical protein A6A07_13700 [Streptomyces sp. CB03911]